MAESSLSIDINTLREEVGMRHGWGRVVSAMTNTQLADFDRVSNRALREFYFPAIDPGTPVYEWSFLRKDATITVLNTTGDYDMPDDFGGTILDESVVWSTAGTKQPRPIKVTPTQIQALRSNENSTGWPRYFSVRNKVHAPTTGQRWEMILYPTANTVVNSNPLAFRYVYVPNSLSNTNKYPAGGAQYSEVVLASHLAAGELLLDGNPSGPHRNHFITLLTTAVRNDNQQKQNAGGGIV